MFQLDPTVFAESEADLVLHTMSGLNHSNVSQKTMQRLDSICFIYLHKDTYNQKNA